MEENIPIEESIKKGNKSASKWLIFAIIAAILILLAVGFAIGYIFTDKGCLEDPLRCGLEKINAANNDNFACTCHSEKSGSFCFNEEKIKFDENCLNFP